MTAEPRQTPKPLAFPHSRWHLLCYHCSVVGSLMCSLLHQRTFASGSLHLAAANVLVTGRNFRKPLKTAKMTNQLHVEVGTECEPKHEKCFVLFVVLFLSLAFTSSCSKPCVYEATGEKSQSETMVVALTRILRVLARTPQEARNQPGRRQSNQRRPRGQNPTPGFEA